MGQWNGVEIITHYETEAEKTVPDSCVVVDLAEMNDVSIKLKECAINRPRAKTAPSQTRICLVSHTLLVGIIKCLHSFAV